MRKAYDTILADYVEAETAAQNSGFEPYRYECPCCWEGVHLCAVDSQKEITHFRHSSGNNSVQCENYLGNPNTIINTALSRQNIRDKVEFYFSSTTKLFSIGVKFNFDEITEYEQDAASFQVRKSSSSNPSISIPIRNSLIDGFATLFLNRVNFSGIIKGGIIGGLEQLGTYKIDCRFNKDNLKSKIETIAQLKSKIKLYNKDAGYLIRMHLMKMKSPMFLNIDPPYVVKGSQLYTNFFTERDHLNLQRVIIKHLDANYPWIITYDDCPLVRDIYKQYPMQEYCIIHNAGRTVLGKEIVITNIPTDRFMW